MAINLCYRMTVYAGLYASADTSILTPASGSSHNDSFKVATIEGITGFQPYMDAPRGKRGSLSVPEQKLEVGNYVVDILDKRVSTGNANRWVSAFFGNVNGKMEIVGKKAFIEESTDGGSSWSPFFVGQITDVALSNSLKVSITIKDNVNYLKEQMFTQYPRVSYATYKTILPSSLSQDITNEEGNIIFRREAGIEFDFIEKNPGMFYDRVTLSVSRNGRNDIRNIWPLDTTFGINDVYFGMGGRLQDIRIIFRIGANTYVFAVESIRFANNSNSEKTPPRVDSLSLFPLMVDDGGVGVPNDLPSGTVSDAEFWIFKYDKIGNENGVYLINTWDTILKDLLDGKFYQPTLVAGTYFPTSILANRSVAYDSSSIASIVSQYHIPRPAFYVEKSYSGVEWLEKNLLAPYSIGYTMEPSVSASVPQCRARFFSTAAPISTSALLTLNEADIIANVPGWNAVRPVHRVEGKHYVEFETRKSEDTSYGAAVQVYGTKTIQNSTILVNDLNQDDSAETIEIDMNGLRAFASIITPALQTTYQQGDINYRSRKVRDLLQPILNRFKAGSPSIIVKTLRNANTDTMKVGDFILVDLSVLPNQAIHARGGSRLMQVLNKYAVGINYEMELLDSGLNQTMASPTVGAPTSAMRGVVSSSISTTQNALVNVQFAAVPLGNVAPSQNDGAWTSAALITINNTTQTVAFNNVPEGRTIYVRARTQSPYNEDLKLPSPWVVSTGLNLQTIPTPGTVSVSNINSRSATISWVNTNGSLPIEIFMASPAGTLTQKVADLPPSSSVYLARGLNLNSSTSHRVGVRYLDPYIGNGSFSTVDFTAAGAAPKLDAPAAIRLYVSR